MKKGIIALLVVLALLILIAPGIVGRLAEQSVDENLDRAAGKSDEFVITSQGFDRGWFSSEGQHRVEVQSGKLRTALLEMADGESTGSLPVLVIDTRLDHGLVPLTSMARDGGTLKPGLGSAVSTLSLELPDGEAIPLPGAIYSDVALNGSIDSNYVLEAGTHAADDGYFEWGDVNVHVAVDAGTGGVVFDGSVDTIAASDPDETVRIGKIEFSGNQSPTPFGFPIGDIDFALDSMAFASPGSPGVELGRLSIRGTSEVDGDRVNSRATWQLDPSTVPVIGELGITATITLQDVDGAAMGALKNKLDSLPPSDDASLVVPALETEIQRVLAAGLQINIEQLDISLPQGTVATKVSLLVAETDPDTFEWTSLLLALDATAELQVPAELVDLATLLTPQAGAIVEMGFLKQNGDVYEMAAAYKKGLLTVNGVPMPMPGVQ